MRSLQRHFPILLLAITLLFFSVCSHGTTKKSALTTKTYNILTEVYALIEQQQYAAAANKLAAFSAANKVNDYDHAVIQQTNGILYQALAKYRQAITAFKAALSSDMLAASINHQLLYQLAQLLITEAAYKEGLSYLERWFAAEPKPTPEAHILAAIGHYHLQQHQRLIWHTEQAVTKKIPPPLMWQELLLSGYYAIDEHKKAIPLLINIISKEPNKKQFWLQLINSYQYIKNTEKALAIYTLAYHKKILDEDDIMHLAHYYLHQDMPYRAAMLLQQETGQRQLNSNEDRLKLIADSWLLAREDDKAEEILLRLAALSNKEAYLQLGRLYAKRHDWQQAYKLLKPLTEKPGEEYAKEIDLYFGIAALNMKKYMESRSALQRARANKKTRELAKFWLNHPHMKKEVRANQQTKAALNP